MENFQLNNDIKVFYLAAKSFPDGVLEAHNELQAKLPTIENRKFFGISSPGENGSILYKAAVEELYDGEGKKAGCERFTIKAGKYISTFIADFMKDVPAVSKAFRKLLAYPGIDPNGYCLEIYEGSSDVRCLVPLIT